MPAIMPKAMKTAPTSDKPVPRKIMPMRMRRRLAPPQMSFLESFAIDFVQFRRRGGGASLYVGGNA